MKVEIELMSGPLKNEIVRPEDVQKNIDALDRAIKGKSFCSDFVLLCDTKSILEGIKKNLSRVDLKRRGY